MKNKAWRVVVTFAMVWCPAESWCSFRRAWHCKGCRRSRSRRRTQCRFRLPSSEVGLCLNAAYAAGNKRLPDALLLPELAGGRASHVKTATKLNPKPYCAPGDCRPVGRHLCLTRARKMVLAAAFSPAALPTGSQTHSHSVHPTRLSQSFGWTVDNFALKRTRQCRSLQQIRAASDDESSYDIDELAKRLSQEADRLRRSESGKEASSSGGWSDQRPSDDPIFGPKVCSARISCSSNADTCAQPVPISAVHS